MDVAALPSLTQTTGTVAAPTTKSLPTAVAAKSENMLAGNFVQADAGPSKYLQARLDSFQTEKSFGDTMSALLTSMTAQFATTMAKAGTSSVAAVINKYKVEDSVGRVVDQEVGESAQDNLDATRQDIEDRAEAAATGQSEDAAGETPDATAASDAATATEAVQAAAQAAKTPPAVQTAQAEPAGQADETAQAPAQAVPAPGAAIDIQV